MDRDNRNDDTPYAVYCNGDSIPGQSSCGLVFLAESDYLRQLSKPDYGWSCPHCGSTARWDDCCQVTNPPGVDETEG